ncbi:hypothetical protein DL765_002894 [Monosporascus sp. GIB2]|nr:hypothetical protein DL765_002894 [Monosporascus sp. GIB2]
MQRAHTPQGGAASRHAPDPPCLASGILFRHRRSPSDMCHLRASPPASSYACVRITTAHTPVAARQPTTSVDAAGEIAIPVLLPRSPEELQDPNIKVKAPTGAGTGTGASGASAREGQQGVREGDSDGVADPGL